MDYSTLNRKFRQMTDGGMTDLLLYLIQSEKMFNRALELQSKDPLCKQNVAEIYANLASIYSIRQQYQKALDTTLKAIKVS